jgi:hypothetical protein
VEEERTFAERLVAKLMSGAARLGAALRVGASLEEAGPPPLPPTLRALQGQLAEVDRLVRLNDPQGVYALCPLDVR